MILLFYKISSQAFAITILLFAAFKFYSDKKISQIDEVTLVAQNWEMLNIREPKIVLNKIIVENNKRLNSDNLEMLTKYEAQISEFNLTVVEKLEESKIVLDIDEEIFIGSSNDSDIIDSTEGFDDAMDVAVESSETELESKNIVNEIADRVVIKETAILKNQNKISGNYKSDFKDSKNTFEENKSEATDIVVFDYTTKKDLVASNGNASKKNSPIKPNGKKTPSKIDFDNAIGEMQELMFGEKIPESRIADASKKNQNRTVASNLMKKNQNTSFLTSTSSSSFMSQEGDILEKDNSIYSSLIDNLKIKPEDFNSRITIDPIYVSHSSIKLDSQIKNKTLTRNVLSDEIYDVDKNGNVVINQNLNKNSRQYLQIEAPHFVETRLEINLAKNENREYHPVIVTQFFLGELYAKLGLKGEYGHVLVEVGDQEVDLEIDRPSIKIYYDQNLNEVVAKDAKYIMFVGLRPGIAVLESYNKESSSYKVVFVKENTILYEEISNEYHPEQQFSFMTKLAFAKEESPAILKQSDVIDEFSGRSLEKNSPNQFKTLKNANFLNGPEFISVNFQDSNTLLMVEDFEDKIVLPTVDFKTIVYDVFEILNPKEACIIEYDLKNITYIDYLTEIVNVKKIGKNNYSYESQTYSPTVKFVDSDGHFNPQISKTAVKMLLFVDADEANIMISARAEDDQEIHKNIVCEKGSWIKI